MILWSGGRKNHVNDQSIRSNIFHYTVYQYDYQTELYFAIELYLLLTQISMKKLKLPILQVSILMTGLYGQKWPFHSGVDVSSKQSKAIRDAFTDFIWEKMQNEK